MAAGAEDAGSSPLCADRPCADTQRGELLLGLFKLKTRYWHTLEMTPRKTQRQKGYLRAEVGDIVRVLWGDLTPAHAGNAYEEDYVFAEPTMGDDAVNRRGWVPHHLLEFVEVEIPDELGGDPSLVATPADERDTWFHADH